MTDQHDTHSAAIPDAALTAAHTRLTAAVRDLLQPTTTALRRADTVDQAADVAAAQQWHDARIQALRDQHATAAARRDDAGMARARAAERQAAALGDTAGVERARAAHAAAARWRDKAGMRRALTRLIEREHAHQARVRGWRTGQGLVPSLLDQLIDAVTSPDQSGTRSSAGLARWLYDVDASAALASIRSTVGARTDEELPARIRSWAGLAGHWRTTQPAKLLAAADTAAGWVRTAQAAVTSQRVKTIDAPCPRCRVLVAHVEDATGAVVRRPALEIHVASGVARCVVPSCGARWDVGRLSFLGGLLAHQERERRWLVAVLAVDGMAAAGGEWADLALTVATVWARIGAAHSAAPREAA